MAKKKKKNESATVICAECGKENMRGTYFCVGCGAPLIEATAPPEYDDLLESFEIPEELSVNESDSFDDLLDDDFDLDADINDFDIEGNIETTEETIENPLGGADDSLDESLWDSDLSDDILDLPDDLEEPTEEDEETPLETDDINLDEIDADLDSSILGYEEDLSEPNYEEIMTKPVNPTIENTILSTTSEDIVFSAPLLAIPNKDVLVNREDIDFSGAIIGEKLVICAEGEKYKALIAPETEVACLVSARGTEAEVLKHDYMLRMCDPTLEEKINAYAYLQENIEVVHTIFGEKPLEDIYQDDVQKYLNLKDATPALIKTNIDNDVVAILAQLEPEKQDEIAELITSLEVETVSKATAVMIVGSGGDMAEARNAIMQDIRITEMMKALMTEKAKPKEKRDFYRKCSIY